MKHYAPLSTDFSAVCAEVLEDIQSQLDAETVDNTLRGWHMLATKVIDAASILPSLGPILEQETFNVVAISRKKIIDTAPLHYTNLPWDLIFVPLHNADQCTVSFYDVEPDATLYNEKFPEGIAPTHGHYDPDLCTLVETVSITGPFIVKAGSVWTFENLDKESVASFLVLFSETEVSTAYFE